MTASDRRTLTRRRFVAGTLATGATAAVPAAAEAAKHKRKPKHTRKPTSKHHVKHGPRRRS